MGGDGSVRGDIFREPQTTIGAQDLLQLGAKCHGFLRRFSVLEMVVQRVPFLKVIFPEAAKWRQRFVVISKGCLYIYIDEFATSPFRCFSLRGYDQIIRKNCLDSRKVFSLCSSEQQSGRERHTFCSATEDNLKKWIESLETEMLLANEESDEVDLDEDVFVSGEVEGEEPNEEHTGKPVTLKEYTPLLFRRQRPSNHPKQTKTTIKKKPLPDPRREKSDDEDDDHNYDTISEIYLPMRRRLPELHSPAQPMEQQKLKTSPATPKPKPKTKPKPKSKPVQRRLSSRDDFEFKGSDRVQVQSILKSKPAGTYLVRQSRDKDNEVLSVQTSDGLKEFRIFFKNEEYSLDHNTCFPTVESLLDHYTESPLPNRDDSLSTGYIFSEDG